MECTGRRLIAVVTLGLSLGLVGCGDTGDATTTTATPDDGVVTITSDFDAGSDGWASDVTDYTEATRPEDFLTETGVSPPGLEAGTDFVHVAVTNLSDDMFMYLRRPVTMEGGLVADTTYRLSGTVEFASSAPTGCAGIGGAPGESVWMKLGASAVEPVPLSEDGEFRLSVDKGGQSEGGPNATVIGTIENGVPCEQALEMQEPPYAVVTLSGELEHTVTAGHDGSLWLFVGTDSGFEGRTSIYYDRIELTLTPVR